MSGNILPTGTVSVNAASSVSAENAASVFSTWSGRGVMQQNKIKAVGVFIAVNAIFLIIMKYAVLPLLERQLQEKSDHTKRVIKVLFVGTLLVILNVGVAKLVRYSLNKIELCTIVGLALAIYQTVIARQTPFPTPPSSSSYKPPEQDAARLEDEKTSVDDDSEAAILDRRATQLENEAKKSERQATGFEHEAQMLEREASRLESHAIASESYATRLEHQAMRLGGEATRLGGKSTKANDAAKEAATQAAHQASLNRSSAQRAREEARDSRHIAQVARDNAESDRQRALYARQKAKKAATTPATLSSQQPKGT